MLDKNVLQIFKIASKDNSRPILTGVKFSKIEKDGSWAIKLAATDGYRLTEKTVNVDYEPTFSDMIVPARAVEAVCKLLDKNRKLLLSDNQFKIMYTKYEPEGVLERTITIGEKIQGDFPDYQTVIPESTPLATISVNAKYLIEALKQANGTTVTLELRDPASPVLVKEDYETSVTSAVMPLRS